MKKDNFVREKLETLHNSEGLDYVPPDRTQMNIQIAEQFARTVTMSSSHPHKKTTKIRILIRGIATCLAAIFFIGVLSVLISLKDEKNDFYGNSENLVSSPYSAAQLEEKYDVILPRYTEFIQFSVIVFRYTNGTDAYANIIVTFDSFQVYLIIVLLDGFEFTNKPLYDSLEDRGTTSLFGYSYRIINEAEIAYAAFDYGDYNYYLKVISTQPTILEDVLETFA